LKAWPLACPLPALPLKAALLKAALLKAAPGRVELQLGSYGPALRGLASPPG
jgi:hypothetical protein